jgi:hypothetical protein
VANLPEPIRERSLVAPNPSLVRAAVSPTAIVVTAAGVGIGLLAQSPVLAVVLGVGAWCGRMVAALIAQKRRERKARPKPADLDPWSVPEPWRQLVQQAMAAQTHFDQTVQDWPEGPIRERLVTLQPRVYVSVEQVGAIVKRGAALGGWSGGVAIPGRPSADQLSEQLRQVTDERQELGAEAAQRDAILARTEESIAAQLRAVHNAEEAAAMTHDRLRLLVATLDQTVTSLLALGVDGAEAGAEILETSLAFVSDEIAALHRGLTDATSSAAVNPVLPPPGPPKP